jgi:hypothetical protein
VLRGGGFNTDASTYTFLREIKGFVNKLRNGKPVAQKIEVGKGRAWC